MSGNEQPKREPLLTGIILQAMGISRARPDTNYEEATTWREGARDAILWYENEITEGRLLVVKAVRWDDCTWYRGPERGNSYRIMACCKYKNTFDEITPRCPGCGNKIVEA